MMKSETRRNISAITFFCAAALAPLLMLQGCGGGSGGNPVTPTPAPTITTVTLSNFQSAEVVIGQVDFTGDGRNQGGTADANTIDSPYGNAAVADGVLYLPEYGNNRLLGFNLIPTQNNAAADFVLGQPDFFTTANGLSALDFTGSQQVVISEGKMFLASYSNDRVLIWNSIPTSGAVPADVVLGQPDFATAGGNCTATGLDAIESVAVAGGKIIATDAGNNRVLIWNSIPTTDGVPADIVLGQQSFTNCAANDSDDDGAEDLPTASTLNWPAGVWSDGVRIVVVDTSNNRVLIWNSFPTSNFTPADVVLGQGDFAHVTENDDDQDDVADAPTARTLSDPYNGVYSNGEQLFVADSDNNRVLVWNSFPTSNFTPADVVLGQGDFAHATENDDDQNDATDLPTARTLYYPTGVYQSGEQIIVSDNSNNRYLIYNGQ